MKVADAYRDDLSGLCVAVFVGEEEVGDASFVGGEFAVSVTQSRLVELFVAALDEGGIALGVERLAAARKLFV